MSLRSIRPHAFPYRDLRRDPRREGRCGTPVRWILAVLSAKLCVASEGNECPLAPSSMEEACRAEPVVRCISESSRLDS